MFGSGAAVCEQPATSAANATAQRISDANLSRPFLTFISFSSIAAATSRSRDSTCPDKKTCCTSNRYWTLVQPSGTTIRLPNEPVHVPLSVQRKLLFIAAGSYSCTLVLHAGRHDVVPKYDWRTSCPYRLISRAHA